MTQAADVLDNFAALPAGEVLSLVAAMEQLLDDMGESGTSVCLAAKARARIAFEPFRNKSEPADGLMSLDLARHIEKELDR